MSSEFNERRKFVSVQRWGNLQVALEKRFEMSSAGILWVGGSKCTKQVKWGKKPSVFGSQTFFSGIWRWKCCIAGGWACFFFFFFCCFPCQERRKGLIVVSDTGGKAARKDCADLNCVHRSSVGAESVPRAVQPRVVFQARTSCGLVLSQEPQAGFSWLYRQGWFWKCLAFLGRAHASDLCQNVGRLLVAFPKSQVSQIFSLWGLYERLGFCA